MFEHATWPLEPYWLKGQKGRLFSLYFPATERPKAAVLYIPPFSEEMNRCRNMAAIQARAFAASGVACLIMDLFGTGDSDGLFEEATWSTWISDVLVAVDWLEEKTQQPVILWGMRLGALLSAEVAQTDPKRFNRLLFWQPVADGKAMMTQFLRIRVANLMDWSLPAETTKGMRAALQTGQSLEVSGYTLPSDLALNIDQKKLSSFAQLQDVQIDWLEWVNGPEESLSMGSQKTIDALSANNRVHAQGFVGPSFWTMWRREWAPDLVNKTTQLLA